MAAPRAVMGINPELLGDDLWRHFHGGERDELVPDILMIYSVVF
jgi:hypothetical protein